MKKVFAILVVAATFASCGGGENKDTKTDSTKMMSDSSKMMTDSSKMMSDSSKMKMDSTKTDTAKKAKM